MAAVADLNRAFLDAAFERLARRLEGSAPGEEASLLEVVSEHSDAVPFLRLAEVLRLTSFESNLLLLAVAPEIDDGLGRLIANAQGGDSRWPTVALAWRLFCETRDEWVASRDSLRPDSVLFRFEFLELEGPRLPLPDRTVRAEARVADAILGRRLPDSRLSGRLRYRAAGREGNALSDRLSGSEGPRLVNLHGVPEEDLESFASEALSGLSLPLLAANVAGFSRAEAVALVREGLIEQTALFLGGCAPEPGPETDTWFRLLRDSGSVAFLGSEAPIRKPPGVPAGEWISMEVERPSRPTREAIWRESTGSDVPLDIADFALTRSEILEATAIALTGTLGGPHEKLRAACRDLSRHRMGEFSQPLKSLRGWEDMVLPADSEAKLRELCDQVRNQSRVLDGLGFRARLSRGLGVNALFSGPSGTGKTMASEIVASDLGRELYRVDIARVVSKYIGETEKHLREVFREAERARCVVLFDEADALFGKRTEVKDSHDRYANIEVSYLLQLIEETEHAVVLLATNRRDAIDEAFLRRFRFLVDFPAPEPSLRERLWRKSFPDQVRVSGLNYRALADGLILTGAGIRNVALTAAYLAAADGGVVTPELLARAARREFEKLGRPSAFTAAAFAERKGGAS
ncbi:ATP-binding protein [Tundrisphaera lichenicola]|uniref:ATP-binding protein n=1 Tax=Tundrisphaera lichenicola TaxID=2029860 RepID=UPI003EBDBFB4